MSSLYNLEPLPTAKLLLHTTSGSLTISLFAKQTPLASRNFLQHCLDGYYNNTIFHRLIPNFILQGGDPTGTGTGGLSSLPNGDPFQDEFHSRLKFNRRGLLGMANNNKDSNGSQFFFTLGETPELQRKHTLFGRVEGETIFNLVKMGEGELVEGGERPLYPTRITGCEVLVNPFEDMVARVVKSSTMEEGGRGGDKKKRKKAAGRNVLSFAEEEGEDAVNAPVLKKVKANPKLVDTLGDKDVTKKTKVVKPKKVERVLDDDSEESEEESTKPAPPPTKAPPPPSNLQPTDDPADDILPPSKSNLSQTNAEIAALKATMKRKIDLPASNQKEPPKSVLESMIPSTSTRGRKRGKVNDEKGALDLFKAFRQKLDGIPHDHDQDAEKEGKNDLDGQMNGDKAEEAEDEEAALCDLHFIANCQSCKSWDDADGERGEDGAGEEDEDGKWMAHRLTFAKDTLGKDLEWKRKMEEIEVIDPREKARVIEEERRGKKGGKGRR